MVDDKTAVGRPKGGDPQPTAVTNLNDPWQNRAVTGFVVNAYARLGGHGFAIFGQDKSVNRLGLRQPILASGKIPDFAGIFYGTTDPCLATKLCNGPSRPPVASMTTRTGAQPLNYFTNSVSPFWSRENVHVLPWGSSPTSRSALEISIPTNTDEYSTVLHPPPGLAKSRLTAPRQLFRFDRDKDAATHAWLRAPQLPRRQRSTTPEPVPPLSQGTRSDKYLYPPHFSSALERNSEYLQTKTQGGQREDPFCLNDS